MPARTATSPASAWRSRRSAGSTSPSASRWRRRSGSASTRSSRSGPTSRSSSGCPTWSPGAGSDAGATRTKAELVDGAWVANGAKQFITNSGSEITSCVTVTAKTGERVSTGSTDAPRPEISAIILPLGTEGLTVEPAYDKLGWHASDTHALTLVDARVPESHLLGERGRGFAQFLATLDDGRVAIASLAVGCIQACVDASVKYAGERQTFGVPIGRKQGLAFQISDLEVMLQASRLLTYKAAALKDAMDRGAGGRLADTELGGEQRQGRRDQAEAERHHEGDAGQCPDLRGEVAQEGHYSTGRP
ncbi:MAG TPA: acyl-CoA dehydrogenase family protein, partial [Nocardioidaceae bacterium]|nr:acyl-CoA dehydrogenase family protein [Nocardioidaceae bacterium]